MNNQGKYNSQLIGSFLVVISAITFSTAGVFTKGVEASSWDVVFWRGMFAAGFTAVYVMWKGDFSREFLKMGKGGWCVAALGASGTVAFISALKMTSITNVALIYASAPLIAAVLAWIWIGEQLGIKLLTSCVVAFLGVVVIVWGGPAAVSNAGDFLALWMTLVIAGLMVVYRRYPLIPVAGPSAVSSIILLPIAMFFSTTDASGPFGVDLIEICILAGFGLVFAIASVTLFEGAIRLPAAQTALLSGLELPFAVVLGWLIFGEKPIVATIVGGSMIVASVLASQMRQ